MCGFLSICSQDKFNYEDIKKYNDLSKLINHRGPDSFDFFKSDNYLSFFYRLSIRDRTNSSSQQIKSHCGRYIISFNGEIYSLENLEGIHINNYKSDTKALSELISEMGIKVLSNIRGMFSITVFDKIKECIYIYRDPFGIKPLFYRFDNNKLVLCSEQQPLIKKNSSLDKKQCIRYLRMGLSNDNESTFFNEIKQIPKGELLKFNLKDGLLETINNKCNLDNIDLSKSRNFNSIEHRKFLSQTLDNHLISDVELSSTISSGLDSTYISLFLQNKINTKAKTYTLESNFFKSELDNNLINDLSQLSISKIFINSNFSLENIKNIITILSSPFRTSSWLFLNDLFELISTNTSSKVILVGEGGDEIYSGYSRLFYPFLFCLENDKNEIYFDEVINNFSINTKTSINTIESNYHNYKNGLNLRTDYEDSKYWGIINEEFKDVGIERHLLSLDDFKNLNYDSELFYKENLKRYFKRSLMPSDLNILDHLSMRYGLELRVPFIDYELYSYIMKFSYKNHFKRGFNKYMLRDASVLSPNSIRWNPIKKQRPNSNSLIVYKLYPNLIKKYLSIPNEFINSYNAINLFEKDLEIENKKSSDFWFRVFTFLIFNEKYK